MPIFERVRVSETCKTGPHTEFLGPSEAGPSAHLLCGVRSLPPPCGEARVLVTDHQYSPPPLRVRACLKILILYNGP